MFLVHIPGLLELFQDTNYLNPSRRISMSVALSRLRAIRSEIQHRALLYQIHELDGSTFRLISMRVTYV